LRGREAQSVIQKGEASEGDTLWMKKRAENRALNVRGNGLAGEIRQATKLITRSGGALKIKS